jgi:hypothetical protein
MSRPLIRAALWTVCGSAALTGAFTSGGCITRSSAPSATQPATAIDPRTMDPAYWWSQPAAASAEGTDFQSLWNAAEAAARRFLFTIDRIDYRAGLMTTLPMTSAQFFELWRPDVQSAPDLARSTLATERRTIRFEFSRHADGVRYTAVPKVLVERHAIVGRRITSVLQYQQIAAPAAGPVDSATGVVPAEYWYPIERDRELEQALANWMQRRQR